MTTKKIDNIEYPKESEFTYHLVVGKSGRAWLYPLNSDHPADNIHCTNSANWDIVGEGYGGSTLKFNTDKGEFLLKGGWHSNSDALLSDTGIDITDKCLTYVVIALKAESTYPSYLMEDILHDDNGWVLGLYDRGDSLAKRFANELGVKVFKFTQSLGGGSMGWVHPDTVSEQFSNPILI